MVPLQILAATVLASDSSGTRPDSLLRAHVHRLSVEVGEGYETSMFRVGGQHDWRRRAIGDGPWVFAGHLEVAAGGWFGHSKWGENRNLIDLGITPVWRFEYARPRGVTPHVEAAVGFHYISETRINVRTGFGSAFQFGDHAGIGVSLGSEKQYELTFRFQHLSNGGIRRPNHGINFSQLRFAWAPRR